jgi:RNA-dependent RNA polymerase
VEGRLEHCVIDLIRTSNITDGSSISAQVIINLAENGVPSSVFQSMITSNVDDVVSWLTDLEGEDASIRLRDNIAREAAVIASRRAREQVGEARARGYKSYEDHKADDDERDYEEVVDGEKEQSSAWWRDPISGLPSSLEETAIEFLDSGFTVQDCWVLAEKMKNVANTALDKRFKPPKYKITVPMSCSGFIMPGKPTNRRNDLILLVIKISDPFGILEPGEIFIRRSRPLRMCNADGTEVLSDIIRGPVLVTRSPCVLPTDVQKVICHLFNVFLPSTLTFVQVTAVDRQQLHQYIDVIVFPIKGSRSLASMLGGGRFYTRRS